MYYNILQYLEETEAKYRDKIAYADESEEYSFTRLLDCAKRIGTMVAFKVGQHSPIVIYTEKKASCVAAFLGAVYAGCFYVPIDSQMPLDRVKLIFETLKPALIIYDDTTSKEVDDIDCSIDRVHISEAVLTNIDQKRLDSIRCESKSTDLLYVLFTSGSTGVPKGVTISHLAVIDFMEWICGRYRLDEAVRLCNQAPFYFDASVPDLFIPLKTGATTFIPSKMRYTFPKKILQYIVENEINTLVWVPSALCNVVNCKAFEIIKPSTIRLVIFCGEVMPCKHLNEWIKNVPLAKYVNMYGPTEATYACMYYDIERAFSDEEVLPLGKACENSAVLVINDEGNVAKEGEIGELCILGQCLSNGYYGAPERTKEVFVQNPTNDKWMEIMYKTGDLAYRTEDVFYFSGRRDYQIKRLGHRIELGEIENAVISIEGVDSACCLYNRDTSEIIVVYSGTNKTENIASYISKKLPGYMHPNKYQYLDKMPMNINGKIDRVKLNKLYAEG